MDINKFTNGNVVKYNNRYDTIMSQLSYNEYLIEHCGKLIVVNILDLQPVELKDNELRKMGFNKKGKVINEKTKKESIAWSKVFDIDGEEQEMILTVSDDCPELTLEDITGIDHFVPTEYKYVHQLQNAHLYLFDEMPKFEN